MRQRLPIPYASALLMPIVALVLTACAARTPSLVDPLEDDWIDDDAMLVASNQNATSPLVFVASEDGTVYYFGFNDLLASFAVRRGQRVELNADEIKPGMATRVTVDGELMLESGNKRSTVNRFYFLPDRKR